MCRGQVASAVVQEAKADSLPLVAAQLAIASALSMSCDAFSPWTSRALASSENPSAVGSLNTVATGAVWSSKMLRMLAANSVALRRRIRRGPGVPLWHALAVGMLVGAGGKATLVMEVGWVSPGVADPMDPADPVDPADPAPGAGLAPGAGAAT